MSTTPQSIRRAIAIAAIALSQTEAQTQRRKAFVKAELDELAASIKAHGLINPILVRPLTDGPSAKGFGFELVAGERRYVAAKSAGLAEIDATVRELTDEQVLEIQLIENLQRSDLHPLHEAEGYEQLMKVHGHKADEIADKVGKSKRYVFARTQLLDLGKKAREAFYAGDLSLSIALLIARLDTKSQERALKDVLERDGFGDPMTYRQAREHLHREFTFGLDKAGFDITDATLVANAGPCTSCPKRSGNQPELFADIERADVCTDPACFQLKRDAHTAVILKQAKAEGQQVITGTEAKKAVAFENDHTVSIMSSYARPDDTCYEDGKHRTWSQLMKAADSLSAEAKTPKLLKTPGGKVVEVFERAPLLEKLRKAGVVAKAQSYSPPARSAPKVNEKSEIEKKVRGRIFRALFDKAPTKLSRKIIEDRVLDEINSVLVDVMGLCEALGWLDFDMDRPAKEIAKLSEADLYRLLGVINLADDLSPHGTAPQLMAAAKDAKIDVAKIRKAVADEEKAKKTAPAKASKKKAARKPK